MMNFAFVLVSNDQSYYDSDGLGSMSSFYSEYTSPCFAPLPHQPSSSCPSTCSPQSSKQYCPRVAKRKNSYPQRSDKAGQVAGISAYPGELIFSAASASVHLCGCPFFFLNTWLLYLFVNKVLVQYSCGSSSWNYFWTLPAITLYPGQATAGSLRCPTRRRLVSTEW